METGGTATNSLLEKAEEFVRNLFEHKVPKEYSYHSIDHTMRVVRKLKELAANTGCDEENQEILALSAMFHDTGFSQSYDNHEEASKKIAIGFLRQQGFPVKKIDLIVGCINATKMSSMPANRLQMLIKDADTSSLGSRNFFEYTEYLRQELNTVKGEHIDEMGWNYINLQFMKDHRFFTEAGRMRFGPMKKQNLKQIERNLGLRKQQGKQKSKLVTIGSSKSAQTQFKTALRNHIDLSAIADNKANTMLSVTSLIISLAIPILGTQLNDNPNLLIPTIILLAVSVTAITYATLAIRPILMKGKTTMEDINQKQSNLFFFGNFFKMKYADYEDGIKYVVADDELLDSAITRDLFFLGMSLGRKYMYLRRCYNVFMYGMIIAVVAFAIAFAIGTGDIPPIATG
jgi:predicted metal-dependent HD superfamily phosphohydrolase